jgi:GntR family transcriptional regulator/MocR family aminotransferase
MPSQQHIPNTFYLSLVTIDRQAGQSLYRQIYHGIKTAVRDQRLAPGTKLPSTRDLSLIWDVSRNTIRNAFQQLIAEGYLEARVGKGTFVLGPRKAILPKREGRIERTRSLSQIGQFMERFGRSATLIGAAPKAFTVGVPDYADFPHKIWMRVLNRCQRRLHHERRLEAPVNGLPALRQAIAAHLVSARGLRCTAEQIDIVPGAISGMLIAMHALLDPGDQTWMENRA